MKKSKGVLSRWATVLIVLAVLFAAAPVWAQGATQGQVALNLANVLGLTLPAGATAADAIGALNGVGITVPGGINAGAAADGSFIASLYTSVAAAYAAGKISSKAGLGSPCADVAGACTMAGVPSNTSVSALTGAGCSAAQAKAGVAYGSSVAGGPGGGPGGPVSFGFGPPVGYGGAGGAGGGGGGGTSPSPSK